MKKAVFLLLICMAVSLSGCATLLVMMIPKTGTSTSSSSTTNTTQTPISGSFFISGTINSGGLVTSEPIGVALFASKNDLQGGGHGPITAEVLVLTSGSAHYSFSTNEAISFILVAYYPVNVPQPLWVGGPGITSNVGKNQAISNLTTVNLSLAAPNPTVNFTLYQITGP